MLYHNCCCCCCCCKIKKSTKTESKSQKQIYAFQYDYLDSIIIIFGIWPVLVANTKVSIYVSALEILLMLLYRARKGSANSQQLKELPSALSWKYIYMETQLNKAKILVSVDQWISLTVQSRIWHSIPCYITETWWWYFGCVVNSSLLFFNWKKKRRIIITKYKQTQSSHHITSHRATIDNETR